MLSFKFDGFPENIIVRRLVSNIKFILWQFETCPESKEIREILSKNSIDLILMNVDLNNNKKWDLLQNYTGFRKVPHLTDLQYQRNINGAEEIKHYLEREYNLK